MRKVRKFSMSTDGDDEDEMGEIQECPSVASGAFYYLLRSRYLGTGGRIPHT